MATNSVHNITLDSLNDKQMASLSKLRETASDLLNPEHDDHYLLRWIVARNFDHRKAEQMLRKHMELRKRWNLDSLLADYKAHPVLKRYYAGGISGYDMEGCPVWIGPSVFFDWRGLTLSAKRHDILLYVCYLMEAVCEDFKEQSKKVEHRVDKFVFIVDMEGYGFSHLLEPGMDMMLDTFDLVEKNYPEVVKACYIINSSSILPIVYNLVKPFLHEATRKKIVILGKNWNERLLSCISADQLPVRWGGTQTEDGDPACPSKVLPGGKVDPSCYVSGESLVQEHQTVIHKTVSRGCSLQLEFPVKAGQVLKWVFWTKKYDISFGVEHQSTDGEKTEAVRAKRLSCNRIPEDGYCMCDTDGKYVVKFDNHYSWTHSKSLSYVMEVVTPESEAEPDDVTKQMSEMSFS